MPTEEAHSAEFGGMPPEGLIGAIANELTAAEEARDDCHDDLRRSWHQGRVSALMDVKRSTEWWVAAVRKATDAPCQTCTYPSRETVNMVCQTCGWDYANGEKPSAPPAQETGDEQCELLPNDGDETCMTHGVGRDRACESCRVHYPIPPEVPGS